VVSTKSPLHAVQVELQQGYSLSPVEALALARRIQELVDERLGGARHKGQISYQAISSMNREESRWLSAAK